MGCLAVCSPASLSHIKSYSVFPSTSPQKFRSNRWAYAVRLMSCVSLCLAIVAPSISAAAQLKLKSRTVAVTDVSRTSVTVSIKRKSVTRDISCFRETPGSTSVSRGRTIFSSLSDQITYAQQQLRRTRGARAKRKLNDEITLKKALKSAGRSACIEPAFLSMQAYTGPFGLAQAQRLLEVFALGGRPGTADAYVSVGLNNAVADLLAEKPDNQVEDFRNKLTCGSNPYNTTNPDVCFRNGNINDFYMDGVVAGLNWRSIYSNNPVRMALSEWMLDQRAPGNPRVLSNCSKWFFRKYLEMVDSFVVSGDYKQYVADAVQDPFLHGKWLSGTTNHAGLLRTGNEDFGREFLELMTTGVSKPDGTPVYNDFDVYQSSLAMSGLAETTLTDSSDNQICVVGTFRDLHRTGTKTLFAGTAQAMAVENSADMAREIFIKQRDQVAYELARRLWSRFVSSRGTTQAHLKLAKIIIDNDFRLWPVIERMMKSKAFYAAESNETILKNPHTLFVTFARMSGIPVGNYSQMVDSLNKTGMLLGAPPTVFGFTYQNYQLASDVYQLERFNSLVAHTLYQNLDTLNQRYGWTPHNGLVNGIQLTGQPALDLVTEALKRLNMAATVTPGQRDALVQFLNYSLGDCYSNSDSECFVLNGARKKLYRDAPDVGDTSDDFYRLRALYAMVANMPGFGTM